MLDKYVLKENPKVNAIFWDGELNTLNTLIEEGMALEDSYNAIDGSVFIGRIYEGVEVGEVCYPGEYIVQLFEDTVCILSKEDFEENYILVENNPKLLE